MGHYVSLSLPEHFPSLSTPHLAISIPALQNTTSYYSLLFNPPPTNPHSLTSSPLRSSSLRPQWQLSPTDGVQRFCIGNMNHFLDIYTAAGDQLAQLGGANVTTVPAVAQFHPTCDWVAGGTASGKLCLWM